MEPRIYINGNKKRPYISPALLDKLLNHLIGSYDTGYQNIDRKPIKEFMDDIDFDLIGSMFGILEKDGFISQYFLNNASIDLEIEGSAVTFERRGGYTIQEELLNKELVLLQAQIKDLQKRNIIANTDKIVSTIGNISKLLTSVFSI